MVSFTSAISMPHVARDTSPIILASIPDVLSSETPLAEATPERISLPDAVSAMACAAISRRHMSVQGPAIV